MRKLLFLLGVVALTQPAFAGGTWKSSDYGDMATPITDTDRSIYESAQRCEGDLSRFVFFNPDAFAVFEKDDKGEVYRLWNAAADRAIHDICVNIH